MAMMKASCAQFRHATPLEHLHALVRSEEQMSKTLETIENRPGVVLYTLANPERRKTLEKFCTEKRIPFVSILDQSLAMMGRYLGASVSHEIAAQRTLDSDYYDRIAALDFAMAHDDGQNLMGLREADIILLGISRTSKTPTSIYLANRGYKTGNIPLVPTSPIPPVLDSFDNPFIVGLVAQPERISQIRSQRLVGLNENRTTSYTKLENIQDEMKDAKRLFAKKGYPVVDVTRRSIEETSAKIITLYQRRQQRHG